MTSEPTKPATSRSMLGCWIMLAVGLLLAAIFILSPGGPGPEPGYRSSCTNNLKKLGIALDEYHNTYKTFPPAYVVGADGKPMHSWRVLLLPFIEDVDLKELYKQYDFDEPWNGPHNSRLADKMPPVFRCPSSDDVSNQTSYVAVVGPVTAWPGATSVSMTDVRDGLSKTIQVVEVLNSGINWLEPRDVSFDQAVQGVNEPTVKPGISSHHKGGAHFLFCDGSVHFILDNQFAPQVLHDFLTADGGETVTLPGEMSTSP